MTRTRNLRGDQTRADRRVKWAGQTLAEVQAGVDPATLIDNETGRPVNPDESFSPAPEAAPPDPPEPTSPTAEPAPSASQKSPFPEGFPEELKQMFLLVGEAYHRKPASSGEETLLCDEPNGQPGPDLPG